MISLCNNLQQLMRINGNLSVSELARLSNIPQPTLHHILNGATKSPRRSALSALAKYFSISIAQLVGEEAIAYKIPEEVKKHFKIKTIPIIEWEMVISWPDHCDNKSFKEIILDKEVSCNSFALIMNDTSMEPIFPKNCLLILDTDKKPQDRDFVIAQLYSSTGLNFNRLLIDDNEHYLKKLSSDGTNQLIKLNDQTDKIIATLIEVRIQF